MSNQQTTLDQKSVTAARMLGVEMIEASHSGHPGIALSCQQAMAQRCSTVCCI